MSGTLARVEAGKVEFMAIRELPKGRISPPAEQEPKSIVTAPAGGSGQVLAASSLSMSNGPIASDHVEKTQALSIASTKAIDQIVQSVDLEVKKQLALEDNRRSSAISSSAELTKVSPLSPSVLSWGRWSQQVVTGDSEPSQWVQTPDFSKLVISDGVFTLFGPVGTRWTGGREGLFEFELRDARVYLRDSGGAILMGSVSDGKLSLDLASSSFKTQMVGTHGQLANPVTVKAEGYVRDDGTFRSSAISSASLVGVMANGGKEAAYSFSMPVSTASGSGASFGGLTRWGR
jgi:hypothetical protein